MANKPLSAPLRASVVVTLVTGVAVTVVAFLANRGGTPQPADSWSHETTPVETTHAAIGVAEAFGKRVEAMEARVAQDPENRQLRLEFARLLHDGHRAATAVPHYRKAIELDPSQAQTYYDLAAALSGEGEWEAAVSTLEERLALDPKDAVALYNVGAIRAGQGRSEEALRYWRLARSITSDPDLLATIDAGFARVEGV